MSFEGEGRIIRVSRGDERIEKAVGCGGTGYVLLWK